MNNELRKKRVADFQARADLAPRSVYRHKTSDSLYIPIHPFSDEPETLARLDLSPGDCKWVDAWCLINNDATLFQQAAVGSGFSQKPRLYARQTDNELNWVYLVSIVKTDSIDREGFEDAISRFEALGFPDDRQFSSISSAGLTRIGNATLE